MGNKRAPIAEAVPPRSRLKILVASMDHPHHASLGELHKVPRG
jgi:hypothetical protein